MISLNPSKTYKIYTDQGNKNSILFKFRSEINRSQQIVDREVEKSINLKIKHSRKRVRTTELNRKSLFSNKNNDDNFINNEFRNMNNNSISKFHLNNKIKKDNIYMNMNMNFDSNGIFMKPQTANGFFKSDINSISRNNFFNTQIKINNDPENNNIQKECRSDKNTPEKDLKDPDNRINLNSNVFRMNSGVINQTNSFNDLANKTGFFILNKMNSKNNLINKNEFNKGNKNATQNYFFPSVKIANYRKKSYDINYVNNWFEKNQIPTQSYTPHLVNNIEYQSNSIIDQMRVLLDNINHFKLQYMQGQNVKNNKFYSNNFYLIMLKIFHKL